MMKRLNLCWRIAVLVCLIHGSLSVAAPLNNIPKQTVTGSRSVGTFGWNYAYDIEFKDGQVKVSIEVKLQPDAGATQAQIDAVKDTWESGVENMWNGKFNIVKDGTWSYPVVFDVIFVDPHHTVKVAPGQHGVAGKVTNMTHWHAGDTGAVAAHEFGHMFGLWDEYSAGAKDPSGPILDGTSIMGSVGPGAAPKARHFQPFADWLKSKSPTQTFTVEPKVTGVSTIGPLSNFDVYNNSGTNANDYELKLKGVKKADVTGTFNGYGNPPTMTDTTDGVDIRWSGGDIPSGQYRHFGVRLKNGVNPEGASSTWTYNSAVIAANVGVGVQHYWSPAVITPNGIAASIRNVSDEPLRISYRYSMVLPEPIPLDDLTRDLVVPWMNGGAWTSLMFLDPGQFVTNIFPLNEPGNAIVGQVQVFSPANPLEPLVFFTNEGVGLELSPPHGLVTGDFDFNDDWSVDDLDDMATAVGDPAAFMVLHGLSFDELLELGDLDQNGVFDPQDEMLAHQWVPTGQAMGYPVILLNDPYADFDGDGDVDQIDFAAVQECVSGDGHWYPEDLQHCYMFDGDHDGDVDSDDMDTFELCASGPGIMADVTCDGP
ncbi:MAG: hypothetical protein QUV05_18205 [Phycisphaerae bacterium]|nr:hypothetical protein [Phycisphaerae bacterium]